MCRIRLQRFLALAGIGSRRDCEQLILDGLVRVNGRKVTGMPVFVDPERDVVTLKGRKIGPATRFVYYLLNKPKAVLCVESDPYGRQAIGDLVPPSPRVFPANSLEAQASGLVLLTNDRQLAKALSGRACPLKMAYSVTVKGPVNARHIEKIRKGAHLPDGRSQVAHVRVLACNQGRSVLGIEVGPGMRCQVTQLLLRVGLEVVALRMIALGPLGIKGVGMGLWRRLTAREVAMLKRAIEQGRQRRTGRRGDGLPRSS